MKSIKCLLHRSSINGLTVSEYSLKTGKHITEIIKQSGSKGKTVRQIYKDTLGYPEKVVDHVFGQLEIYYPGKVGIIKEVNGKNRI